MIVAIFIVKEENRGQEGEFLKFARWFSRKNIKPENINVNIQAKTHSLIGSTIQKNEFRYLKLLNSEIIVYVIEKNSFMKSMSKRFLNEKFVDGDVKRLIEILRQLLLETGGECIRKPCDIDFRLFVHWGIDNVSAAEYDFAQNIKNIDLENIFNNTNVKPKTFKSFAISTTRKVSYQQIFDTTKGIANVPESVEEINQLVAVFEGCADKVSDMSINIVKLADNYKNSDIDFKGCNIVLVPAGVRDDFIKKNVLPIAQLLSKHNTKITLPLSSKLIDVDASEYLVDFSKVKKFYPLFLCGGSVDLFDFGATPPEEFVVNIDHFSSAQDSWGQLLDSIWNRIQHWILHDKCGNGISESVFRSWCAGAFRMFCFLDKDVHGTGGTIDWSSLKYSPACFWKNNLERVNKRLSGQDGLHWQIPLWERLFSQELENFRKAVSDSERQKNFYNFFEDNVLVHPDGSEVAYSSPVRKLTGLLIDDDADKGVKEIMRELKKTSNGDAFSLKPLVADVQKKDQNIIHAIIDEFKRIESDFETYDFVLLDLRLNDDQDCDPSGYQLIKIIKLFFPQLPIIIYSRYDDMGHMSRAFTMGADWFIRKDEIRKLPRHMKSLSKLNWQKEWNGKKEWNTINRLRLCGNIMIRGGENFNEKRKYLTYKCLENLPDKDIWGEVMGAGFSSSVTFRARKGKSVDGVSFQNPVIIKIDTAFSTMTEYERYFRFIRPYIANESGRVDSKELTLDRENSAIVYTFAGKNDDSRVLSRMKDMLTQDTRYMSRCDYKKYEAVFDEIFDEILPKIHRVSLKPKDEYEMSSYPNRFFGEKDFENGGFVGNYLSRVPLSRHFEVTAFVDQDHCGESIPFEVHSVIRAENGKKVIEAYEIIDPESRLPSYSKMRVILDGNIVDHVARYRELKQGQTLWVTGNSDNIIRLDNTVLDSIKAILYPENQEIVAFYSGVKDDDFENKQGKKNGDEFLADKNRKANDCFINLCKLMGVEYDGIALERDKSHIGIVEKMFSEVNKIIKQDKDGKRFYSKIGIVHGDMNYANIMLDAKKDSDDIKDNKDVWLIDFARTRRDIIAHDFNVMFTATFSQLFNNELWGDSGIDDSERYAARIIRIFKKFISDVMFAKEDEIPDYIANDRRFSFFYKIFRRIRKAALKDDQMTEDMYVLTTALCCLYTFKIFLKNEKNIQGAAALLATAYICIDRLKNKNTTL